MNDYLLNVEESSVKSQQQQNSSTKDFTFLFPLSNVDSVWGRESFDRITVSCHENVCSFALKYASIVGRDEIESVVNEGLLRKAEAEVPAPPLPPGLVLYYYVCSIFPFFWCPPPLPPPAPVPEMIVPKNAPREDDSDSDQIDDRFLLTSPHYELYASPGPYDYNLARASIIRTYGVGSFEALIAVPDKKESERFPVVIFGHGLGASSLNYMTKIRHLASHGFIVVTPESFDLFDGVDLVECLPWLDAENKNPSSILFGVVDMDKVGVTGHSMGGSGTLAAASLAASGGAIKCIAAIHPGPLVRGLEPVDIPAFISAAENDWVTPPLVIRGTAYDSGLLRGPKVMATLADAGHNEPVDGAGYQRWTPYLTAWFKAYLYSDVKASTLIWGITSPQSLQVNTQMQSVESNPGFSVEVEEFSERTNDTFALSGKIKNRLESARDFEIFYYSPLDIDHINLVPEVTPLLSEDEASPFTIEGSVNTTEPFDVYVIGRDRYQNGSTLASFKKPINDAIT